jgi:broad specificity phosphatase PhoE
MPEILFWGVRHGRTQGNEDNRYRGWSNEEFAQLGPEGQADIMEAALYLKKQGLKFDIILSDDTDRAKASAAILQQILDIPESEVDKRLRPLNVGKFTGKSKYFHPLDSYLKNRNKKIPGGENMVGFDKRLASVVRDILELIAQTKVRVLVILHGSTISFLHNATNPGKQVGYEGIVHPGGVISFSKEGVTTRLKKKSAEGEHPDSAHEDKKLEQSAVLYMPGKMIARTAGARCGSCWKFITAGGCTEVDGDIAADKVCGLYAHGTPFEVDPEFKITKVSKKVAGYGDGDTHCGKCEYFGGPGKCVKVKSTPEPIEETGCCNKFEKEDSPINI